MLNQCVLVGRIVSDDINEEIKVAVSRSFKNSDEEYETDIIPIQLVGSLFNNVKEYCKKGDIIGVKGRIEGRADGSFIIAEKVTFLSGKKEEE